MPQTCAGGAVHGPRGEELLQFLPGHKSLRVTPNVVFGGILNAVGNNTFGGTGDAQILGFVVLGFSLFPFSYDFNSAGVFTGKLLKVGDGRFIDQKVLPVAHYPNAEAHRAVHLRRNVRII